MKDCSKRLREFVTNSKSFIGFEFNGHYEMNADNFLKMFSHYIETGENYLDEYSEMTWLSWGKSAGSPLTIGHFSTEYFPKKTRTKLKKWLKGDSYWNLDSFISSERRKDVEAAIVFSVEFDKKKKVRDRKKKLWKKQNNGRGGHAE